MKRVAFGVTYPAELAHPLHRRLAREDGVTRMELLMWGPTENVTTLSWYDADRETVRELLTAVESLSTASLVAGEGGGRVADSGASSDRNSDGGTYAFVRQTEFEFDDSLLELLGAASVVFIPPVTFVEDGTATFEAVGETADLSAFYRRLRELLDTRIERVHDFRPGGTPADLTARQAAALEAGLAVGYYDVPRTGTVADVAAELDCAASTAGELLRKAEAAVVAGYASARSPVGFG